DADFDVAADRRILQTVIRDQHVDTLPEQQRRARRAVAADRDRRAGTLVDQAGFVADFARLRSRIEQGRCAYATAVAATQHAGREAARPQRFHQRDHERRLAAAA